MTGFWGPPTATVDWCEANYAVTPYIAEFWNTLSSLALVLAGGVGAIHLRRRPRFALAFGLLALVGVGSIAFHGTLRFSLQMLDELPMLYLVTLITYVLIEDRSPPRFGRWFPFVLAGYDLFLTVLCVGSRGQLEFYSFQLGFGSLEFFCLGRAFLLYRRTRDLALRRLFVGGLVAYLAGIAVWFADLRQCAFFDAWLPTHGLFNPQLHAVWHVLVALGFYLLLSFIAQLQHLPEPTRA